MMTFPDFCKGNLNMVERVGQSFTNPSENWLPVLILYSQRQGISICALEPSEEMKEALPQLLQELFRQYLPDYACLVLSCWSTLLPDQDPESPLNQLALAMNREFGVKNNPQRVEVLLVICSDGTSQKVQKAEIKRHPDSPPTLGDWEEVESYGGRFVDSLRGAFQACTNKKGKKK